MTTNKEDCSIVEDLKGVGEELEFKTTFEKKEKREKREKFSY
jgi:hypothetical protein